MEGIKFGFPSTTLATPTVFDLFTRSGGKTGLIFSQIISGVNSAADALGIPGPRLPTNIRIPGLSGYGSLGGLPPAIRRARGLDSGLGQVWEEVLAALTGTGGTTGSVGGAGASSTATAAVVTPQLTPELIKLFASLAGGAGKGGPDPNSLQSDPSTGLMVDPATGGAIDPTTGQLVSKDSAAASLSSGSGVSPLMIAGGLAAVIALGAVVYFATKE